MVYSEPKLNILYDRDIPLTDCSVNDCIPYALRHVPVAFCKDDERVWYATDLLNRYLESHTDCILVTHEGRFSGILDGREWVANFLKFPTREFFLKSSGDIMSKESILQTEPNTKMSKVIETWKNLRRAVAVIYNHDSSLSPVSLRAVLGIIAISKTETRISEIKSKNAVVVNRDEPMKNILLRMLQKKVRRVIVEGTQNYTSDRLIIEHVVNDLHFLKNTEDVLENSLEDHNFARMVEIDKDIPLSELCKTLGALKHPCVTYHGNIITPWDIVETIWQ